MTVRLTATLTNIRGEFIRDTNYTVLNQRKSEIIFPFRFHNILILTEI